MCLIRFTGQPTPVNRLVERPTFCHNSLTLISHTNLVHLYPSPINISTVNVRITNMTVISARSLAELKNLSMLCETTDTMPISTVVVAVAISQACDWIKCKSPCR